MVWVLQHCQEAGCVLVFTYTIALLTVVPRGLGVKGFSRLLSHSLNYSWVSNDLLVVTCYTETKMSFANIARNSVMGVQVHQFNSRSY